MKINGIHVEYYMKNGQTLTDDEFRFVNPVDEKNEGYVELLKKVRKIVEESLKEGFEGNVVIGCLYVRTSEIQAIRILPIEEREEP